jgi:hypothetical protein
MTGATGAPIPNAVFHVLLALAAVIVTGRLLGRLLVRVRQPPVIGEVLAGILLGPSVLGRVAPDVSAYILPAPVAPFLNVIAQLGVTLYMFLVGVELNADRVQSHAHAPVATSREHRGAVPPRISARVVALSAPVDERRAVHEPSRSLLASPCRSPHSPCWHASCPTVA